MYGFALLKVPPGSGGSPGCEGALSSSKSTPTLALPLWIIASAMCSVAPALIRAPTASLYQVGSIPATTLLQATAKASAETLTTPTGKPASENEAFLPVARSNLRTSVRAPTTETRTHDTSLGALVSATSSSPTASSLLPCLLFDSTPQALTPIRPSAVKTANPLRMVILQVDSAHLATLGCNTG